MKKIKLAIVIATALMPQMVFCGQTELYYSWAECEDLASLDYDACEKCMKNPSIETIDGDGVGIRFEVYTNDNGDSSYTCYDDVPSYLRCAPGYYGFPWSNDWDELGGCTKCPDGGTSDGSTYGKETSITDCYIPRNKPMTDNTGTYIYTSDCYYTK